MNPSPRDNARDVHRDRVNRGLFDPSMLGDLSRPLDAPDFTRAIMGRLGYMRVSPTVARRHRMWTWSRRAGLTLAGIVAVGIGLRIHDQSDRARRPLGITVPSALGRDLQQQQRRFEDVIQTIRSFTPGPPLPARPIEAPTDTKPRMLPSDVVDTSPVPGRWV